MAESGRIRLFAMRRVREDASRYLRWFCMSSYDGADDDEDAIALSSNEPVTAGH